MPLDRSGSTLRLPARHASAGLLSAGIAKCSVLGFLVGGLIMGALGGCAVQKAPPNALAPAPHDPARVVLEPETFASELASNDSRRVILDVRKPEDFEAARVAGARRVDLDAWSKAAREGEGFRDLASWSGRIASLGVDRDTRVIVYDAGNMTDAARAWFIIQYFGVKEVSVINGGWKNLQPLLGSASVASGPDQSTVRIADFQAKPLGAVRLASRDDVKQFSRDKSVAILDARTADEYSGKDKMRNARGGHVPGASNIPHRSMLDENGRLRSPAELRSILETQGFTPDESTVAYCQSGGRASLAALAAVRAGFANVSNYYNSMSEWLNDESCPIEEVAAKP